MDAHLNRCPECLHLYSEAVKDRLRGTDPDGGSDTIGRLIELGLTAGPQRIDPAPKRRVPWLLIAPVSAAVAVAAIVLVLNPWAPPERRDLSLSPAVYAAASSYSSRALVLPGGEDAADRVPVPFRGSWKDSLSGYLRGEWAAYETDPSNTRSALEAIIGYLALERRDSAEGCLRVYRRGNPADPVGRILQAVVDFLYGDSEAARRTLEGVATEHPEYRSLAELNSGLILAREGRRPEAKEMFRRAWKRDPESPIGRRAARELEGF